MKIKEKFWEIGKEKTHNTLKEGTRHRRGNTFGEGR